MVVVVGVGGERLPRLAGFGQGRGRTVDERLDDNTHVKTERSAAV